MKTMVKIIYSIVSNLDAFFLRVKFTRFSLTLALHYIWPRVTISIASMNIGVVEWLPSSP
jgi:hypothetical protein